MNALLAWCAGFLEVGTRQSMTRLVTLLLALAATLIGAAIFAVATRPHLDSAAAQVIAALATVVGAFVAAGCVALINRSQEPPKE